MLLAPLRCAALTNTIPEGSMNNRLVRSTAVTLAATFSVASAICAGAQNPPATASDENADPKATEQWEPVPAAFSPGAIDSAPPPDAFALSDGRKLAPRA